MEGKSYEKSSEPGVAAELKDLVRRAQGGDTSALPRMREIIDAHPEIWQFVGDVAGLAERAWIATLAANSALAVESLKHKLAEMKANLAGEHPTELEKMLVGQIISCWMEMQWLQGTQANPGERNLKQAGYWLKRQESAQRRHLAAIKTLATTRALMPSGLAPLNSLKLHEEQNKARLVV
jgi:hypothetical protein